VTNEVASATSFVILSRAAAKDPFPIDA